MSYSPKPSKFARQPGYPPRRKKSGTSVWVILAIIGGVVFLGMVGLCGLGFFLLQKAGQDSDVMKVVSAPNGTSISIPDNWGTMPASFRNEEADMQYGNMIGENYVMTMTENKSDLVGVADFDEASSGDELLQAYIDLILPPMTSDGLTVVATTDVTVNGMKGIRHKLSGPFEGIDLVYWLTIVVGKQQIHQIHVWTLASRAEKNEELLLNVTSTFTER